MSQEKLIRSVFRGSSQRLINIPSLFHGENVEIDAGLTWDKRPSMIYETVVKLVALWNKCVI